MKKLFFFILIVLFFSFTVYSQTSTWSWAQGVGGTKSDYGNSISTDMAGNSYVTGAYISASIVLGTTSTLTNANSAGTTRDIYIIKYNSFGNVLWAKSVGGSSNDSGLGIHVDANGHVFVVGSFSSPTISFGTTVLTNMGGNDIFVAKYDTSGSVLWAKSAGGSSSEDARSVCTDVNGNCNITGVFAGTTLLLGTTTLTNAGGNDMFVAQFDSSGNVVWAKSAGNTGDEDGSSITTDVSGNIYVTGSFNSPTLVFGNTTLINKGMFDLFIVKYDGSGNLKWARGIGDSDDDVGKSIDVDAIGNSYVAGYFRSASMTVGTATVTNSGGADILVLKYDSSGAALWARGVGDFDNDWAYSICADPGGKSYVTGAFASPTVQFGTTTLTNTDQVSSTTDIFIFSYDAAGNPDWARSATGGTTVTDGEWSYGITVDAAGNNYIIGNIKSPFITFGTFTVTSNGAYDIFVTKLGSVCNFLPPAICLVTVDSLSKNNNIIWDKTPYTSAVDSFIIYREVSLNNYKQIGAVDFPGLSLFEDTVRTKYFPNTGDPNTGTYRYKIRIRDTCGNFSAMSPYHNVIYITNSSGTFSWPQLYTIENGPNPVSSYVLMRDNNNTGVFIPVNSVAGTQQSVTDPNYAAWQATAVWRVETLLGISCTPTSKFMLPMAATVNKTRSNSYKTFVTGLPGEKFNNIVSVFPNPSGGNFHLKINDPKVKAAYVELFDMMGCLIYSSLIEDSEVEISVPEISKGIYQLQLTTEFATEIKKIVIK